MSKSMRGAAKSVNGTAEKAGTQKRRIAKVAPRRAARPSLGRSTGSGMGVITGAALMTGIAAGAGVIFRKQLISILGQGFEKARVAGGNLGDSTRTTGSALARKVDLQGLLVQLGLRRKRSFFSRVFPAVGAVAGLLAAAGVTAWLTKAPPVVGAVAASGRPDAAKETAKEEESSRIAKDFASESYEEHNGVASETAHVHS